MPLRVYNTLSRQKEDFKTVQPGKVGMYVCGPTVYKPSHIGHMVGPVIFDTIARYLKYQGYEVRFVVNITDVDDKLIARAQQENTTVKDLAEKMTADYRDCLKQLGVVTITDMPKATEHIGDMIGMIGKLIEKGHAYPAAGDVYFNVTSDPDYGKLCNRDPEQLEAGARIEISDRKRNPGDFALWKGSKPGEPAWESPWGPGRPGWHIECSAMSMRYLGETLDIHGGGLDLQFPHHENELAQSESFTDKPFANYWMHNGLLKMGEGKMAGSKGNVVNVRDLVPKYAGEVIRFLILNSHYRSPIDFNEPDKRLQEMQRALEGFHRFFERYQRITGGSFYALTAPTKRGEFPANGDFLVKVGKLRDAFLASMEDDFNTGGAIGGLFDLLTALNHFAETKKLEETKDPSAVEEFRKGVGVLRELAQILGLFTAAPAAKSLGGDDALVAGLMQLLIDIRNNLRAEAKKITAKDDPTKKALFDQTDQIRKRLGELKVTLEDRPGGTGWRVG
jgi:cysteinyl-tRNA synthetase